MNDEFKKNKTIHVLKLCAEGKCFSCPRSYETYQSVQECKRKLLLDVLDLVNWQNEEIERLEIDLKAMRGAARSYKAESKRLANIIANKIEEKSNMSFDAGYAYGINRLSERLKGYHKEYIKTHVTGNLKQPDYIPIKYIDEAISSLLK